MNGIDSSRVSQECYLMPGDLRVSVHPLRVTTILGSCVALCLFDAVAGVGGINHFLLPGVASPQDADALRWSDSACLALHARVLAVGARPENLQAKVFGGANVGGLGRGGSLRIGERNVVAVYAVLDALRLQAAAADTGGEAGRKLVFETHTGKAWVRTLAPHAG